MISATATAVGSCMGLVVDLAELNASMISSVGGKAANLGELMRAGMPVPPGFCVTTVAYQDATRSTVDFDVLDSARAAVLDISVPAHISSAVVEAYERMGSSTPVAVRSSATAEDLPNASFAGQQDTYLNVIGTHAVLEAVRRCWASLWTERAIVYRASNGIDHRSVRLAVVIQSMVDAEVAGVLFTANPVTGRRRQAVIDSSPGLGEAIVSGAVNPDHFEVDTPSLQIVSRRIGDKRVAVQPVAGGGTRHVTLHAGSEQASITDRQIRELASLGDCVERYFGCPQDVEWAIDRNGKIWLTQSRPITTLFPVPEPAVDKSGLRVYFCFSLAQGLHRPLTPMGLAALKLFGTSAARLAGIEVPKPLDGPPVFKVAAQRIFFDVTKTLRGPVGRELMPRILDVMEARTAAILRSLLEDPRLSVVNPSRLPFIRRVAKLAIRYGIPLKVFRALVRPHAARRLAHSAGDAVLARLHEPAGSTAIERLDFIERSLERELIGIMPATFPAAATGLGLLALASKLLGSDARPGDLETVLRGTPHNVTTEMNLALWDLAARMRRDGEVSALFGSESADRLARQYSLDQLPPVAQAGIRSFLDRFGHRAVAEIDIGLPRWSEDPAHILGVLSNYLRLHDASAAPDAQFARGANEALEMIQTLTGRARRRGWLRATAVRFALRRARELAGLRELPKYDMVAALATLRAQLSIIGSELAANGTIDEPADVFFLDLSGVRRALLGQPVRHEIAANREAYQLEMRRRRVPNVLLSDGTMPNPARPADSAAWLSGTPASAGKVTGVARVILDPRGASIAPGEVLVAPSTDPGWTPLFLTASALVMEMGGANSHGAVVAREYGIPAVVGVANATLQITNGMPITVDGAAGTIEQSQG